MLVIANLYLAKKPLKSSLQSDSRYSRRNASRNGAALNSRQLAYRRRLWAEMLSDKTDFRLVLHRLWDDKFCQRTRALGLRLHVPEAQRRYWRPLADDWWSTMLWRVMNSKVLGSTGLKIVYSSLWEIHRRATERRLPYGVTQWTRPALTPAKQAGTLDLPTPEGWKAELTLVVGYTGWSKKNGATLHFPKYLENYWR